jgi:predicted GNAT superfamily acetyltransferase
MSKHKYEANFDFVATEIRECTSIEDYEQCMTLQREVFVFPDLEVSPRRHFIVTRRAGGWVLGAFAGDELVGFVHQLAAVKDREVYGYSHMLAVGREYQNKGVGARLKWAQRARALSEGISLIRWTWDPMQARNAHFNLNRLGVTVRNYAVNFYGTDYGLPPAEIESAPAIDSDRLFAEWNLKSDQVETLERGCDEKARGTPATSIAIPANWSALIRDNPSHARKEQRRVRAEFEKAFASGLVCMGFERDPALPRYLLYEA